VVGPLLQQGGWTLHLAQEFGKAERRTADPSTTVGMTILFGNAKYSFQDELSSRPQWRDLRCAFRPSQILTLSAGSHEDTLVLDLWGSLKRSHTIRHYPSGENNATIRLPSRSDPGRADFCLHTTFGVVKLQSPGSATCGNNSAKSVVLHHPVAGFNVPEAITFLPLRSFK
jgi:hypothetical protein